MSDAAASSPLSAVRDFPDRVPAMLVKEWRQGLRAKLFAECLAGFHLVVVVLILPMVGFASGNESGGIQQLVWWLFAALLTGLLPLRGLSALTGERRADTLDTLILTNLKAGRIVGGKWLAIAAQITLTALSLIPYILVLYAGGSLSLPESLLTLLRLTLAGMGLAAAYLALSWNDSWLSRAVPGLVLGWLVMTEFTSPLLANLRETESVHPALAAPGRVVAELVAVSALTVVLLALTAQWLAPAAERHHLIPRGLALLLPWAALLFQDPLVAQTALAVLVLVSLTALTEPWPLEVRPGTGWKTWPGCAAGGPHGVIWAVVAWATALTALALKPGLDLLEPARQLAAWLFCGRALLYGGPASCQFRTGLLVATGLVFGAIQGGLALAGEFLNNPTLREATGAVPVPWRFSAAPASHPALPWITGAAALICTTFAIVALWRSRAGKEDGA